MKNITLNIDYKSNWTLNTKIESAIDLIEYKDEEREKLNLNQLKIFGRNKIINLNIEKSNLF